MERSPSENHKTVKELDAVRQELKTLAMKRRRSAEHEYAYKALLTLYKRKVVTARRDSWREFCTKVETIKDTAKIMKIIRPQRKVGVSLFDNQGMVLNSADTLKNLMDTHFIDSVQMEENDCKRATISSGRKHHHEELYQFIDEQKVSAALESFGPLKAPGPDGFKPLVLTNLTDEFVGYITQLYRIAVQIGQTPRAWRLMKVVFIPKEGKSAYNSAKSYRPITLSNFLLKGLERIIQWFVTDRIVTEPLYAQHAYTVGRSCDTAISEVVDFIEKNTLRKQHVLAVSLDCTGAFDRIKFDSADKAMKMQQIPKSIRDLYRNILEQRCVVAELQGEREVRRPMRGSPQGGVLSPLIWILIMDLILKQFKGTAIKVVGYADDIILLVAGVHPPTMVDVMNQALNKVMKWGSSNGLIFNPTKTQATRFSQCRKFSTWSRVLLNGTEVEYGDDMKYLGVILNRFLLWRPHCQERIKKAKKTINLANSVIGQKWGFVPERALWVYTAMARSVSTYGALVWANSTNDTIRKELTGLQRKAMMTLSSSMRSTPTAGMEAALGLMPLPLTAEEISCHARLRTRELLSDTWDGIGNTKNGHRRKADETLNKIKTCNMPTDRTQRRREWLSVDDVQEPDVTLFTDGSKMDSRAGAGWAATHGDLVIAEESVYLGTEASVFQAEVVAIERSLRWAVESLENDTKVLIRSDSMSAIQALLKPTAESKVVLGCKTLLRLARDNLRIGISWIKGHADHTGNELADLLARKGAELTVATVAPELPVPFSAVKQEIKSHFEKKWQRLWDSREDCRQSRIFFPKVNRGKLKKLCRKSKNSLNILIQAGTGHALVNHHTHQWVDGDDECELCLEGEETTEHLYFECPALWQLRRETNNLDTNFEDKVIIFFSDEVLKNLFSRRAAECGSRPHD